MTGWIVEVTRRVRLEVPATNGPEAREVGLAAAWEWLPGQAHRGDQGYADAWVVRAGDLAPAGETEGPSDA
jgi:hypothetical protein